MKKTTLTRLFIFFLLGVSSLTACANGAGMASSWPGMLFDPNTETIFLASLHHIYAINSTNGTEKWRFPAKADNKISFFAAPELSEDGQLIEGGYDHMVYSINPENGQQNWTFSQANDKFIASALAHSGMIYSPNVNYSLYALNSSGNLSWEFSSQQALWAKPLTDGEKIFLASMDHYIYALDPDTGALIWKTDDLGGAIVSSVALAKDRSLLFVGTLGSNVAAVDLSSGKTRWSTEVKSWVWTIPWVSDEAIYIADQDGNVYRLDPSSGAVRWQIQPDTTGDRGIISAPVVFEDTLYFANEGGVLYAVDATNGSPRWNKTVGGKIYSDLKLADELILVAPNDFESALVAIDSQGNIRWTFAPAK